MEVLKICPFKVEALLKSGEYFNIPVFARDKECLCTLEKCMYYNLYARNGNIKCFRN